MTTTAPKLRPSLKRKAPGLIVERGLRDRGLEIVDGMMRWEEGRGPDRSRSAPPSSRSIGVYKIRDSKMLTEDEREALFDRIAGWCDAWAVGHATPEECDTFGMSDAEIGSPAPSPGSVRCPTTSCSTGNGILSGGPRGS